MRLLHETEAQLAGFSPAKRLLVTLFAVLMIAAGGWYGWIEDTQTQIEETSARNFQLEQQIRRTDLRRLSKKIEEVRRNRLALLEEIQKSTAAARYLRARMQRLAKMRFDQKRTADLLDAVLKKSADLGLRVDKIESTDDRKEITPLLERKKRFEIEGSGAFGRIVSLTHYIESLDMLAKIEQFGISLDPKGSTAFRIEIFAYGEKE